MPIDLSHKKTCSQICHQAWRQISIHIKIQYRLLGRWLISIPPRFDDALDIGK